jgi:ADP-ribose pyrophosphatase YjhB (NUDIX family)
VYCYDCGAACADADVPVCPHCGPRWKLARSAPCTDVLVVRGDEALLVRRARPPYQGWWELPGGFSEKGEHPADTARRELEEELGVTVALTDLLGFYFDAYEDDIVQVTTYVGEAEVEAELRPDPEEITEMRWIARGETIPENIVPSHAARLRDWWSRQRPAIGLDRAENDGAG